MIILPVAFPSHRWIAVPLRAERNSHAVLVLATVVAARHLCHEVAWVPFASSAAVNMLSKAAAVLASLTSADTSRSTAVAG